MLQNINNKPYIETNNIQCQKNHSYCDCCKLNNCKCDANCKCNKGDKKCQN